METDIRNMAIIAWVLGVLAGVSEYLHPTYGLYPAGIALGVWLCAGWLWLRTADAPMIPPC